MNDLDILTALLYIYKKIRIQKKKNNQPFATGPAFYHQGITGTRLSATNYQKGEKCQNTITFKH